MLDRSNMENMGIAAIVLLAILTLVLSVLLGIDPPMPLNVR